MKEEIIAWGVCIGLIALFVGCIWFIEVRYRTAPCETFRYGSTRNMPVRCMKYFSE